MITAQRLYATEGKCFREAVDWMVRLRDPNLSYPAWVRWLGWMAVPENASAFAEADALWRKLRVSTRVMQSGSVAARSAASGEGAAETAQSVSIDPSASRAGWRSGKWAACFAALAIALAVVVLPATWKAAPRMLETTAGEWRKQQLDDETTLYMGPNTQLRIAFTKEWRSISLVRGEALFEVAAEVARPFVVQTDLGTARAVGTVFAVTRLNDRVQVIVREGKVTVSSGQPAEGAEAVEVLAGTEATLFVNAPIETRAVDAERKMQWTTGWCEFDGETLGEIVEQFNRRNKRQIIIGDDSITRVRLSFHRIRCDAPEVFVRSLHMLGVAVLEPDGVTLRSAQSAPRH